MIYPPFDQGFHAEEKGHLPFSWLIDWGVYS
jgi:hypothetical protein